MGGGGVLGAVVCMLLVFVIFPLLWCRRSDAATGDDHRLPPQPVQADRVVHRGAAPRRMRRRTAAGASTSRDAAEDDGDSDEEQVEDEFSKLTVMGQGPSWSNLPIDIILIILRCLELPQALAFATVCKAWRTAAMAAGVPSSSAPLLMSWASLLEEEREEPVRTSSAVTCKFYHLSDANKAYGVSFPQGSFVACCGASHGWLVLVNELSNLVLYNPFTSAAIRLPPITDFACVEAVYGSKGNLKHYLETGKVHETAYLGTWFYQKAVLSCSPSKGGDYDVMLIHRDSDWLSFVRAGQSKWQVAATLVVSGSDRYADCAFHDGRFYTVTYHGMVERWDIDDLSRATRKVIVPAKMHVGPILTRHLLSTPWGDLLQVRTHLELGYPDGIRFQIHRVGQDGCKKVSRKDLMDNDHALFLGVNHSACLPSKNFPKLKAHCIYFSAPWMITSFHLIRRLGHGWGGARAYDLKRRKFEHAVHIPDRKRWNSPIPSEVWITPNL